MKKSLRIFVSVLFFAFAGSALAATATFVDLGTAGNFAVLSKVAISSAGTTIVGDIGVSPVSSTAITGFSLLGVPTTDTFLTSALVTGKVYSANLVPPTPTKMTTAISDMQLAYTAATGGANVPGTGSFLNIGSGTVSTQTLTPGVYTWGSNVSITGDITLDCSSDANAVFVFQISGNLDLATGKKIILTGCHASNIFWAVAGTTFLQAGSHLEGTILAGPATSEITLIAGTPGATVNGRLLGEKTIALQAGTSVTVVNVITNPATNVLSTSATVNGTNGPSAGTDTSFWLGTTSAGPFTASASPVLPAGWTGVDSGGQFANASFNHAYTSLTPNTTYHFVAWSLVDGVWYPGAVLNFTTPTVPIPTPTECEANSPQTIVSDISTLYSGNPTVIVSPIHSTWTVSIPDATWIWGENPIADAVNPTSETFTRTFTIVGTPTGATLDIATDNSYVVSVNGHAIGFDATEFNYISGGQDTYSIPASSLVSGVNVITFTVTNWAMEGGTMAINPAGLLYKLTVNSETCPPPTPTTATISATKIVCDNESDLPNWGAGDPTLQQVTSNTANRYIATHPSCRIAGWNFEWAPDGTNNPGDNIGVAGSPWTPFTSTVTISAGSKTWVREQANSNYIPFSSDTNGSDGWDAVSAEMYCSNDTLNYDNYDYIDPVVAGSTYYCVAFNVLKKAPSPLTLKVHIFKYLKDGNTTSQIPNDLTLAPFPMVATWNATNIGAGTGNYVLGNYHSQSLLKYAADTADMSSPADYTTSEVTDVSSDFLPAGASCVAGKFRLVGYKDGNSLSEAESAAISTTAPVYTGLTSDKYEIVVNEQCPEITPPVCEANTELINNGSFENTTVTTSELWQTFASGTTNLDWLVEWFGGATTFDSATRPEIANIELQRGINGWSASDGSQYTELDSDWFGPSNPLNGEPASVAISQDVPTIPGETYQLKFDFSARPDTVDTENKIEVLVNDVLNSTFGPTAGVSNTSWTSETITFTAGEGSTTKITFRDAGTPNNSLGTFLDNVSMKCQPKVDQVLLGDLHAEDFGVVNYDAGGSLGILKGYTSGWGLTDATFAGATSVVVKLYAASDQLLQTNTAILPKFNADIIGTQFTSPFDVSGTFNYVTDGYWTNHRESEYGQSIPAVKVVATVTLANTKVVTAENTLLTGDPTTILSQDHGSNESERFAVNTFSVGANGPIVPQRGGSVLGASTSSSDVGQVLGVSCGLYMDKHIRLGSPKNDSEQVKKLQEFLNKVLGSNIPVTGFYGPLTFAKVKEFQLQYRDQVLKPWGLNTPTGLVYLSTLRQVNNIECPDIMPNLPPLIPWFLNPDAQ